MITTTHYVRGPISHVSGAVSWPYRILQLSALHTRKATAARRRPLQLTRRSASLTSRRSPLVGDDDRSGVPVASLRRARPSGGGGARDGDAAPHHGPEQLRPGRRLVVQPPQRLRQRRPRPVLQDAGEPP